MSLTKPYSSKQCKWCGEKYPGHYPYQCFKNPKRKAYCISKKGKEYENWVMAKRKWFAKNLPDQDGLYTCYLQISINCPKRMRPRMTTLDHVKPRGSNAKFRYTQSNLKPACRWCNSLKGSRSLEQALKLKQIKL